MGKFVVLLACLLTVGGCTSPDKTHLILEREGYTDIEITGYAFFSCSQEDTFHTGFRATNLAGNRVEGAVCCGVLKNCTIRF